MRGKRKNSGRSENMEVYGQNPKRQNTSNKNTTSGGFHGCYLLTSLSPRYKGHTYIGYTVNPKRRIRQHNGEICSGASTTKKKRPWEMILFIHGFPSSTCALQFEWAWQHPKESLAVREAAAAFKTIGSVANKIKLALTMLTLPSWLPLNLTVSFFSTKYMNHTAAAPPHLKLHCCSIHDLPCYDDDIHLDLDDDDTDVIHPHSPPYHHLHVVDDDDTDVIHPHSPPYHHLHVVDDDDTDVIHPHSPPEETTFNQSKQVTQDFSQKDDLICVIIDDNTQQTHHHTSHIPPDKDHTQLIDLLTPSPHNRIIGATKEPRNPSTSPHIIDLTRSPLFVQL